MKNILLLFLFFVVVVTSALSVKIIGDGGPIMTILITATVAFIIYDYVNNDRKKKRAICQKKMMMRETDEQEPEIDVLENMDFSIDVNDDSKFAVNEEIPLEVKINNGGNIVDTFEQMGSVADNKASNYQRYRGLQESLSIAFKEKNNKYSALPWLEEELREHEDRDWWLDDKYIPEI